MSAHITDLIDRVVIDTRDAKSTTEAMSADWKQRIDSDYEKRVGKKHRG